MKFISVIALALMTVTSTVALTRDPAVVDAFNSRQGLETRDSTDFEDGAFAKRACTPSKCNCIGFNAGLFCGDGNLKCTKGHVYECNADGKTTCDYGVRTSCQKCNKLKC